VSAFKETRSTMLRVLFELTQEAMRAEDSETEDMLRALLLLTLKSTSKVKRPIVWLEPHEWRQAFREAWSQHVLLRILEE
jgi:hypothetical protein